jgi:hypothetical protein
MNAQQNIINDSHIMTLRVICNDDWQLPPVMTIGGDNHVEISFDDMTHEYHRYVYHIQHCGSDWQPSTELFDTDFIDGFNDNPIDNYSESLNTNTLYTHYSFTIPNDRVSLKLSGNYKVSVFNDEDNGEERKPLLIAYFSIVEPQMGISASVSSNTDVDFNNSHQQCAFKLNYGTLTVRDPLQEIKTVILQNRRWDSAVTNPSPNYITPSSIEFVHNKALIFDASNEYRKFEILNVHHTSLNVDRILWFDPYYHANLIDDYPRRNYVFDEDKNGHFLIRNDNNDNNDIASDYMFVHFTLKVNEPLANGELYLNGDFTNNAFTSNYKMTYNVDAKAYEAAMFLKQGYYNYQYLRLPDDKLPASSLPIEGNFFQTENEYIILAYYHPQGSRYDRLVAYKQMRFTIDARQ